MILDLDVFEAVVHYGLAVWFHNKLHVSLVQIISLVFFYGLSFELYWLLDYMAALKAFLEIERRPNSMRSVVYFSGVSPVILSTYFWLICGVMEPGILVFADKYFFLFPSC